MEAATKLERVQPSPTGSEVGVLGVSEDLSGSAPSAAAVVPAGASAIGAVLGRTEWSCVPRHVFRHAIERGYGHVHSRARKVMRIAICIAMGTVVGRSDGALPFFSVCVHRTYNISVCRGNISVAADKFQMRTTSPHLCHSTSAPPASSFLSAGEMTRAINQPQGATRLERVQPASSKGPVGDLGVFGVLGDLRDLGEVLEELGSGENLSSDSGSLGAVICRSVYRHPFRHGISNV